MKESYQREEYCSDQRKGSLRHFQPSEELWVKLQGREAPRVVIRSQFIGLLTKTAISLRRKSRATHLKSMNPSNALSSLWVGAAHGNSNPCRGDFQRNGDFRQLSADGVCCCTAFMVAFLRVSEIRRLALIASGMKPPAVRATPKMNMPQRNACGADRSTNAPRPTIPSQITIKSATSGWRNIVTETLVPVGVDTNRPQTKGKNELRP